MADRADPAYLVVGHLTRAHGIKGELYVRSLTDHPDETFRPGVILHVSDLAGERPSDHFPRLTVQDARPYKEGFLVHFDGLGDRTEAERFRGRYLMRPFQELEDLEEGEVFYHQLLEMDVESVDGEALGVVREVYELGPSDLLEVQGARGTFHVPFVESMVREVDVGGNRIVVELPPGLLDETSS